MDKDSKESVTFKLNSDLQMLEQEMTKMANRLGALNQQVNDVFFLQTIIFSFKTNHQIFRKGAIKK